MHTWIFSLASAALLAVGARAQTQCSSTRPEWFQMSGGEQMAYYNAAKALMSRPNTYSAGNLPPPNPSTLSYEDFVYVHTKLAGQVHGTILFFPFHRALTYMWEQAIRSAGGPASQPYWDWSLNSQDITSSSIFDAATTGTVGKAPDYCLKDGMFKDAGYYFSDIYQPDVPLPFKCLKRNPGGTTYDPNSIAQLLSSSTSFSVFQSNTEDTFHGNTHFSVGGYRTGQMADGSYSPSDPFFWFHHAMMDKQWWRWQNECPEYFNAYSGALSTTLPWVTSMTIQIIQDTINLPICYSQSRGDVKLTNACKSAWPAGGGGAITTPAQTATAAPLTTMISGTLVTVTAPATTTAVGVASDFVKEIFLLMVPPIFHGVRRGYNDSVETTAASSSEAAVVDTYELLPTTTAPYGTGTMTATATATAPACPTETSSTNGVEHGFDNLEDVKCVTDENGKEVCAPDGYKIHYYHPSLVKIVPEDWHFNWTSGTASDPTVRPKALYDASAAVEVYTTPEHWDEPEECNEGHVKYPTQLPDEHFEMMGMNPVKANQTYQLVKFYIDQCNNDPNCISPASIKYNDDNHMAPSKCHTKKKCSKKAARNRTSDDNSAKNKISAAGLRRRTAAGKSGAGGGRPASTSGMMKIYTDDSPGIKVDPVVVLVGSLTFIASVFILHIVGKYMRV
ncbi:hypothetical protein HK101_009654 [Irineochytrium annulatum]|nr:hypothetical protein HK101_009654 [Irineochytrium annulatum]